MKIITVCGMGMGTSLILKMTIESVLKKEGLSAEVVHSDLGSAKALNADLFAISVDMISAFEDSGKNYVAVQSVFDENGVREKVLPIVKKFLEENEK
ncbi:PTS sugar transporter subunit IIB [uncultured Anaerofustis sp.]|uniref:PTS sugar transporter subunit IIB n=1 Tax=uncultured Anaerofustis sp. TaxID=904996 RepID=UPI0025FC1BE0|nr:PTS sugar transporter subunit IIB [uncultured Anaerofustis sp.]